MEVSAPSVLSLNSQVEATAKAGWSEGMFTLDPQNIELGSAATGTISGADYMNVNTAFENIGANIQLLASQNITLDAGTKWNLSASTGQSAGSLLMEAGGNISLGKQGGAAGTITDANDWSVTLQAGNSGQGVVSGTGIVQLFGASAISTAAGSIDVEAGQEACCDGKRGDCDRDCEWRSDERPGWQHQSARVFGQCGWWHEQVRI